MVARSVAGDHAQRAVIAPRAHGQVGDATARRNGRLERPPRSADDGGGRVAPVQLARVRVDRDQPAPAVATTKRACGDQAPSRYDPSSLRVPSAWTTHRAARAPSGARTSRLPPPGRRIGATGTCAAFGATASRTKLPVVDVRDSRRRRRRRAPRPRGRASTAASTACDTRASPRAANTSSATVQARCSAASASGTAIAASSRTSISGSHSRPLSELVGESVECPAKAGVDRSPRQLEQRATSPGRVAEQVAEDDDRALLGPEAGQRGHSGAEVASLGRGRLGCQRRPRRLARACRAARPVDRAVHDDPVQPRRERPAPIERSSARSAPTNASCAMSSAAAASCTMSDAARCAEGQWRRKLLHRLARPLLRGPHERALARLRRPPGSGRPRVTGQGLAMHGDDEHLPLATHPRPREVRRMQEDRSSGRKQAGGPGLRRRARLPVSSPTRTIFLHPTEPLEGAES